MLDKEIVDLNRRVSLKGCIKLIILQLRHFFQVDLLLFSARAFSKLYFLFSLTEHHSKTS